MQRRLAPILLVAAASVMAQYNDYPTGEYEYAANRIVVSPVRVFGGMDPTKRDQGPRTNLAWTPNIDMIELRYERIVGADGTFGFGPLATYYPALDSVKATSWAAGVFGRYYMDLAHGGYVQFSAQWYDETGAKVRNGNAPDTLGKLLPVHDVTVSGPQVSPVVGYCYLVGEHLVLEGQMGFTLGDYTTTVANGPVVTQGDPHAVYKSGTSWGGFYFAQVSVGVAW